MKKRRIPNGVIVNGDCIKVMAKMKPDSVHGGVIDPPYSFNQGFLKSKWDKFDSPKAFQKFSEEWAAEAFRVLKPGAHMIVFCLPKTYHRMASGLEDAGFEIRDMMFWIYGNNFPKNVDIAMHMRKQNLEQHVKDWDGWATVLMSCLEVMVVVRKPCSEKTVAKNLIKHGVGAFNIGQCLVPITDEKERAAHLKVKTVKSRPSNSLGEPGVGRDFKLVQYTQKERRDGRWPTQIIHDGSKQIDDAFNVFAQKGKSPLRFYYCARAAKHERHAAGTNTHPSVKPLNLLRYLLRLIMPKGAIALDPFMGSGSCGMAAMVEGMRYAGIELDKTFYKTAHTRISELATHAEGPIVGDKPKKVKAKVEPKQLSSIQRMKTKMLAYRPSA